jgi:hypothetical protein
VAVLRAQDRVTQQTVQLQVRISSGTHATQLAAGRRCMMLPISARPGWPADLNKVGQYCCARQQMLLSMQSQCAACCTRCVGNLSQFVVTMQYCVQCTPSAHVEGVPACLAGCQGRAIRPGARTAGSASAVEHAVPRLTCSCTSRKAGKQQQRQECVSHTRVQCY